MDPKAFYELFAGGLLIGVLWGILDTIKNGREHLAKQSKAKEES